MFDFRATLRKLLSQNVSPNKVAIGSAVGVFFGFLPLFGVKTLLSYFTSMALRASTTAAIVAVTLHDLLLPILPVVLRAEYQIGFWLMASPHRFAPQMKLKHLKINPFHNWDDVGRIGTPLLLGSLLLGLGCAALAYIVTYFIFWKRKMRKDALVAALLKVDEAGTRETSL